MKRKYTGMTLIEILMVAGIVIVLAGLLIPAMTQVQKVANQTKQRAELNTIELAITTFKNDYGDYPPSNRDSSCEVGANDYSGAQKLAEALCGWDLLGFEPNSVWRSDGSNCSGSRTGVYEQFSNPPTQAQLDTLRSRRGPYLDMTSISVFRLDQLFGTPAPLAGGTYVLCDVFGVRAVQVGDKRVMAGTPILYYRANPASRVHSDGSTTYPNRIYNYYDNEELLKLGKLTGGDHKNIASGATGEAYFYDTYIRDPRTTAVPWPYRADSYLLISAGADGEYGTKDDICNF